MRPFVRRNLVMNLPPIRFRSDIISRLRYYVYRLVDPRTDDTFYVGKGKANRVFSHVAISRSRPEHSYLDEDTRVSLKLERITDIKAAG